MLQKYCLFGDNEGVNLYGGRRKLSTPDNVTIIGPQVFIFYPKSKYLPQLLLFGEVHSNKRPRCSGMKMVDFTKEYIKKRPDTQVFLEEPYKFHKVCEIFSETRPNLVSDLYKMIKKDPKHYKATDNRLVTPLCISELLDKENSKKEICDKLTYYYTTKLMIIATIQIIINFSIKKINQIKNGGLVN